MELGNQITKKKFKPDNERTLLFDISFPLTNHNTCFIGYVYHKLKTKRTCIRYNVAMPYATEYVFKGLLSYFCYI